MSIQAIQSLRADIAKAFNLILNLRAEVLRLQAEVDALKKPTRQKAP